MRSGIRRKLETAVRVRDFNRAHPVSDPSHVALVTRFEDRVGRAHELAVQEESGRAQRRTATKYRQVLRAELRSTLIRYLERVGAVAARERPDLAGRLRSPAPNASNAAFVARTGDMVKLARSIQDVLSANGLAPSQLDALEAGLVRYELAARQADEGRLAHVGARAELLSTTAELSVLSAALDALNRTRFVGDPELLAAWASASNVPEPARKNGTRTAPPPEGGAGAGS